jgi:hypothetical protein
MLAGNVDSAIEWAQRTIKLAEPAGYDEILGHALNNLGTARVNAGDDAGWDDLNRSLSIALVARVRMRKQYCNIHAPHPSAEFPPWSSWAACVFDVAIRMLMSCSTKPDYSQNARRSCNASARWRVSTQTPRG